MQELNDQELEQVVGGTKQFTFNPFGNGINTTSAGSNANSSASGQHAASTSDGSTSVTVGSPVPGAPSLSLSFAFGTGVAY